MRPIILLILMPLLTAGDIASAESVPLPRPRPPTAGPAAVPEEEGPSACRLRLTAELAIAPSVPALDGPGECAVADVVRLEAVILPDGRRVALTPPATLRCDMAEAVVRWVREDVAAAAQVLGSPLRSIDNYASYHCRSRNNIVGAQLSEHGKANALDLRSLRLANGKLVGLTDPEVAREFRENIRKSACARFSTVLGPGSDGYHEDHVHVDLKERPRGRFAMCQWDVRDPEPVTTAEIPATVPLPPPRPNFEAKAARKKL